MESFEKNVGVNPEEEKVEKKVLEFTFTGGGEIANIEIDVKDGNVVIPEDKFLELFNNAGARSEQDGAFKVEIKEPVEDQK
ncbi:hypothetical protein KAU19_04945 [Candidatus Parcubacteria bacterium]|nr:hypothetical protein [Candidatus Parcubacteria bacterium]